MSSNQVKFLSKKIFGVVGASADKSKFGNTVLVWYIQHKKKVFPVNPNVQVIEMLPVARNLNELIIIATVQYLLSPKDIGLSIVTPPKVSELILRQAAEIGIKNVWMQPGSEPDNWQKLTSELGLIAVGGGPCILKS
ncbi:hypothetical protein AYI69_g4353 [Smittium culicis]|uniref:CoA-binding domain-containing protein n=1 Tax=Smittium culicis TaxID=133412 RepID=A0A1R1YEE3_9FUNG|nr:hypothetical protein AYI69_g4353 [Smittium culicis]